MSNLFSAARILLIPLALSVAAGLLVRTAILQSFSIPSSSMAPTLEPGDHILVTPYDGLFRGEPRSGDVVVFWSEPHGELFVKRIVGMPGDLIEIREGAVVRNGRPLSEPYTIASFEQTAMSRRPLHEREYFVMGDNRPNSVDSRAWGPVRRDQIVGRARIIFWSAGTGVSDTAANAMPRVSSAPRPLPIRWSRILAPVN
jgi:signal peptidase I